MMFLRLGAACVVSWIIGYVLFSLAGITGLVLGTPLYFIIGALSVEGAL